MAKHGIRIPTLSVRNKTMKKYPKSFLKASRASRAKASTIINTYNSFGNPVKGLKSLGSAADNLEGHLMLYYPELLDQFHASLMRINEALQSELSTVLGQIEITRQTAVAGASAPRNTNAQLASMFAQLGINR